VSLEKLKKHGDGYLIMSYNKPKKINIELAIFEIEN
jgi:hypothetical protein